MTNEFFQLKGPSKEDFEACAMDQAVKRYQLLLFFARQSIVQKLQAETGLSVEQMREVILRAEAIQSQGSNQS
jgi:hypothetical protein